MAGASPKRRPLMSDAASANSSTCQSTAISSARGKLPGQNDTKGRIPRTARTTPRAPPARASTELSVRHWRTNRPRPAPRAARIAISRSRETARAKSRLAIFAHATNRTEPTAPSSNHSAGRTPLTNSWPRRCAINRRPSSNFGYSRARRPAIRSSSICADVTAMPGPRRARTWTNRAPRFCILGSLQLCPSGVYTSFAIARIAQRASAVRPCRRFERSALALEIQEI